MASKKNYDYYNRFVSPDSDNSNKGRNNDNYNAFVSSQDNSLDARIFRRRRQRLEEEKQNLRSYLTVEDGVLTKWSGYLNDLEIPPGLATEIGKAFQCRRSTLKTIVLPEGIREIQAEAFLGCSVLKSVSLPATMRKIGKRAFSGCKSLRELVIPDGVVEIEDEAFANCTKLKRLVIPDVWAGDVF